MSFTKRNKASYFRFAFLVCAIFSFFISSFPKAANNPNELKKIRQLVIYQLHQGFELSHHPLIEHYSDSLGKNLLYAAAINPDNYQFYLAYNPMLNAFAAADGIILITSELIEQSDRVDEVAGVLAHEISHIVQSHLSRNIKANEMNSIGMGLMILGAVLAKDSDISGALVYGGAAMSAQNQLSYSREFEWEADRLAIDLLVKSGFDARALVTFLNKLNSDNKLQDQSKEFLRTHPLTVSRIAEANSRVSQQTKKIDDSLSFFTDEFVFYQALVNYFANSTRPLKNQTAAKLLTWLKEVNFAKKDIKQNKHEENHQIEKKIAQLRTLIDENPNSRMLMMIKTQHLLELIESHHPNSQQYKNEVKADLDFFSMLYPKYYPSQYYQAWFNFILNENDATSNKNNIEKLLRSQRIGLDFSSYFLSPSLLAEKIAEKSQLETHLQWARARQFEIKNNEKKAFEHYSLAVIAANKNKQMELANFFNDKLRSLKFQLNK